MCTGLRRKLHVSRTTQKTTQSTLLLARHRHRQAEAGAGNNALLHPLIIRPLAHPHSPTRLKRKRRKMKAVRMRPSRMQRRTLLLLMQIRLTKPGERKHPLPNQLPMRQAEAGVVPKITTTTAHNDLTIDRLRLEAMRFRDRLCTRGRKRQCGQLRVGAGATTISCVAKKVCALPTWTTDLDNPCR